MARPSRKNSWDSPANARHRSRWPSPRGPPAGGLDPAPETAACGGIQLGASALAYSRPRVFTDSVKKIWPGHENSIDGKSPKMPASLNSTSTYEEINPGSTCNWGNYFNCERGHHPDAQSWNTGCYGWW